MINLHFAVEDMEGKTVLVFLKPQNPQRDYDIHAWRVLTGSAGSTEQFSYEDQIETDLSSSGDTPDEQIISARVAVQPGQLLQAVSPGGCLRACNRRRHRWRSKAHPQQCGVINQTNPFIQFTCNWYVGGHPVVSMPKVDLNMTVSFEMVPGQFYFMVASAPLAGRPISCRTSRT